MHVQLSRPSNPNAFPRKIGMIILAVATAWAGIAFFSREKSVGLPTATFRASPLNPTMQRSSGRHMGCIGMRPRATPEDEDFEKRMDQLSAAGRRMTKEGSPEKKQSNLNPYKKKEYDFSDEVVYYNGPPHRGDVVVNSLLGATILWLPLTVASITRAVSINYIITDKRVSVITKAPWSDEETRVDAPYDQIKKVASVGRGVGLWGDMAVTTRDNNVLEFRSLDNFKDIEKYIKDKIPSKDSDEFEDYQTY